MNRREFLKKSLEGIVIAAVITAVIPSCRRKSERTTIVGEYQGTYLRTSNYTESNSFTEKGPVSFVFWETSYYCKGQGFLTPYGYSLHKLPPYGYGLYQIIDDKIILKDRAFHIANSDWTLILNGKFEFEFDDNVLRLYQYDKKNNRYHHILLEKLAS